MRADHRPQRDGDPGNPEAEQEYNCHDQEDAGRTAGEADAKQSGYTPLLRIAEILELCQHKNHGRDTRYRAPPVSISASEFTSPVMKIVTSPCQAGLMPITRILMADFTAFK